MKEVRKQRILVFIDWYLPGYKAGGGQRAFANLVSYLREDFDFYIVTRDCDFLEEQPYEGVEQLCWTKQKEGENVYYLPETKVSLNYYKNLFKGVNPDCIYINGVYSWKFSILPLLLIKRLGFKGKVLLGTYGMLAPTAIRIKGWKKRLFLYFARTLGLYRNVVFHATSEQERNDIKSVFGNKQRMKFAPHLPVKYFPVIKKGKKKGGELRMISLARIAPEKNTLYALECLKEVKKGSVLFDLYGPLYDKGYWERCEDIIREMPSNVVVNYKGIAEGNKVLDLIAGYDCFFMPTRGENFGYAILESFMAGRPVVISDQTPWKNLKEKNAGFDLSLNMPEEFTKCIEYMAGLPEDDFFKMCQCAWNEAKVFVGKRELRDYNKRLFDDQ